jgi:excisionase family DNA binding protein
MSKKCEFGVRNDANEALPLVLTVPEAAEKLRIGIGRCYELVRCGKLRNIKVGRRFLIPRTSIFEFLGVPDETLS